MKGGDGRLAGGGDASGEETGGGRSVQEPVGLLLRESADGGAPGEADADRQMLRELVDRISLRELVDAYAQAVDRCRPDLLEQLFLEDGQLIVPHPAGDGRKPIVLDGRHGWERAFAAVAPFTVTGHFVGNHLVRLAGDSATAETYCLAHEVYEPRGETARMQLRLIRYTDTCVRHRGRWLFRTRELHVDWHDDHALGAPRDLFRQTGSGGRRGMEQPC
jgi:hypothetical protein